jgi:hypothetical protein
MAIAIGGRTISYIRRIEILLDIGSHQLPSNVATERGPTRIQWFAILAAL